jgi:predicted transcriptional regulator
MKTTIELSDALFHSAKELASKSQTTMRALVEEGLRRVLNDAQAKTQHAFKLKDASVHGGEILISDPHKWQQLEEDHVAATCAKTAILGDSKI